MITSAEIETIEYLVDQSKIVDTILAGLANDTRGRKGSPSNLRLMLIGMTLSIRHRRSCTVTDVYDLLTTEISTSEKIRLGVCDVNNNVIINLQNFYYFTKVIDARLNYGKGTTDITDVERSRRHDVVRKFCDDMMDIFDLGWASTSFAMDATGLWAWGKGKARPRKVTKSKGEEEASVEETVADSEQLLETGSGFETIDAELVPQEIRDQIDDLNANARATNSSYSPDSGWGFKTGKAGDVEIFYGDHEHTLVQVPDTDQDDDCEPRLIKRFEITPANADVVDVSLGLLDRVGRKVKWLLVDSHYHYKKRDRWLRPLTLRGIHQIHDLRKDEHGFTEQEGMRFAAGRPHCPETPDSLGTILKPAPNAPKEEFGNFFKDIERRRAHALGVNTQPDADGKARYVCPALNGSIGCPRRQGSVQAAIDLGLPLVEIADDNPNLPIPACCTQNTVQVVLDERIHKLSQRLYWGSKTWVKRFRKRTYVEGSYGNRKNQSTENLRRGIHRFSSITMQHLVMTLVNASYNLRMLRNWHERQEAKPGHVCELCANGIHPLLKPFVQPEVVLHLSADEWLALETLRSELVSA